MHISAMWCKGSKGDRMNINDFAEEACKLAESKGLWENGGGRS